MKKGDEAHLGETPKSPRGLIASTSYDSRGFFSDVITYKWFRLNMDSSFDGYDTRLRRSLRKEVVGYIERCHLEDGGYFFARIPPSSAMDTYFAVKSLSILGVEPLRPEAIVNYLLNELWTDAFIGLAGMFAAVEVLNDIGHITSDLRDYVQKRIVVFQNTSGGFGATEDIDVEVSSELEATYRAVRIMRIIGSGFDEPRVMRFVTHLLNPNGGYGRNHFSTLATTFYATEIQRLLGANLKEPPASPRGYLRDKERDWQANLRQGRVVFLEDLFWLVKGLANLGEKPEVPEKVAGFVMACQRANGSFSRATIMGIPTLEYTYYAVAILKEIGAL